MVKHTKALRDTEPSNGDVVSIISSLGGELYRRIKDEKPDYIVPLETKGAVILEMILEGVNGNNSGQYRIVYPRALDFLSHKELSGSRFMVVDDTFFTGRTLRTVKTALTNHGVRNYTLTALFNFSDIYDPDEIDKDIYKETKFVESPKPLSRISHRELLTHIQGEVLSNKLPATYDHLIFESTVRGETYSDLFEDLSDSGRLLYYGRRGAFHTSALLLGDLYDENWAAVPKMRFWYHEKTGALRIAPVAYPASTYRGGARKLSSELMRTFRGNDKEVTPLDRMEAISFGDRVDLMQYMVPYLEKNGVRVRLHERHLLRYYPGEVGKMLVEKVEDSMSSQHATDLPKKSGRVEAVNYMQLVPSVVELLRSEYERQADMVRKRSEFTPKGFTVAELLVKFGGSFSPREIHSAIDYCYDNLLVASFNRQDSQGNFERALRTTEINDQKYLAAEAFGAAIIYSGEKDKCPVWIPNKVYSILQRGLGVKLETLVAMTHYYGDVTSIAVNENTEKMWSTLSSSLWKTHRFRDSFNELRVELERINSKEGEARKLLSTDPRLIPHQSKIDAIHHLCEQSGYEATVLANILCDGYGGTTYLAFNLANLLEEGIGTSTDAEGEALKSFSHHREGLETKLKSLSASRDHVERMRRRATQLRYLTRINAEEFTEKLLLMTYPNAVYGSFEGLFSEVKELQSLMAKNDIESSHDLYEKLGVEVEREDDLLRMGRTGNQGILQWICALSGKPRKKYDEFVYGIKEEQDMWVLAYDLRGGRREIPKKHNISLEEVNRRLHGFIANWIVAYKGRLSPANENLGDRRYGYFKREVDAINAALWIDYHSHLLSKVNPAFAVNSGIAGIGIGHGRIRPDNYGGEEGETLDVLGHQVKLYVDKIADEIGAKNGQPPVWILNPREFSYAESKRIVGGVTSFDNVEMAALQNRLNETSRPWIV